MHPLQAGGVTIYERIEREMTRQGWTVARLVKATGLPRSAIYKWREGTQEPSVASLVKVARALRTSVDYLAGRLEDDDVEHAPAIPGLNEEEEEVVLLFNKDPGFRGVVRALLKDRARKPGSQH